MAPARNFWFRLHCELRDSPKVQRLSGDLFKTWINLLCLAGRDNGRLPKISDVAFFLHKQPAAVGAEMADLHRAGLLDKTTIDGEDVVIVHDWNDWQYQSDSSTLRSRKSRNGDATLHQRRKTGQGRRIGDAAAVKQRAKAAEATPPESESHTDPDRPPEAPPHQGGPFEGEFEIFWERYPHKVGKPEARRAFDKARQGDLVRKGRSPRTAVDLGTIIEGLDRYQREKPADQHWLNPSTFLNQERYFDERSGVEPSTGIRRQSPRASAFGAMADFAQSGVGLGFGPAAAHDGDHDQAGSGEGDTAQIIDLTEQVKLRVS